MTSKRRSAQPQVLPLLGLRSCTRAHSVATTVLLLLPHHHPSRLSASSTYWTTRTSFVSAEFHSFHSSQFRSRSCSGRGDRQVASHGGLSSADVRQGRLASRGHGVFPSIQTRFGLVVEAVQEEYEKGGAERYVWRRLRVANAPCDPSITRSRRRVVLRTPVASLPHLDQIIPVAVDGLR